MAASWQKRFEDSFNDGTLGLTKEPGGGGSLAEVSGNLEAAVSSGDIRWDSVTQVPNLGFENLATWRVSSANAYMCHAKITSDEALSGGPELYHGLFIYIDLDTAWTAAYNRDTDTIDVRFKPGAGFNFAGGSTTGSLSGPIDVWVKIYWNQSVASVTTQEGDSLAAGDMIAYYSTDGVSYTQVHTQASPSTPVKFGVGQWATPGSITSTAKFDFLELWEYSETSSSSSAGGEGTNDDACQEPEGPEFLSAISAKTALETPQILLEWTYADLETPLTQGVLWDWKTSIIRRSIDRYPETKTEGTLILNESFSDSPRTSKSDIDNLIPLRSYYYSLFLEYVDHSSSPCVLSQDIKRLGSRFSGVAVDKRDSIVSGTDGVTNSGSANLDSAGSTFLTDGVQAGFIVELKEGTADDGFYRIVSVNSETQVTLDSNLTVNDTDVDFEVFTDHDKFWISGIDYKRRPSLWRYDSRTQMVDFKVDLSTILDTDEFPRSVLGILTISATDYITLITHKRYIRLPYLNSSPLVTDIAAEWNFSTTSLTDGYDVIGGAVDPSIINAFNTVYLVDRNALEVKAIREDTPSTTVATYDVSGLDEVNSSNLYGVSLDTASSYILVGNRNYVYGFDSATTSPTAADITSLTYLRALLLGDFSHSLALLDSNEFIYIVDDKVDLIRGFQKENRGRGYLWQQSFVSDQNTVALYHLDDDATDSSPNSNDGTNSGMVIDTDARFDDGFLADTATDTVDISAISGEFDGDEGTIELWFQVTDIADLAAGTNWMIDLKVDASNFVRIGISSGSILFEYMAGGTSKTVSLTHPRQDTKFHQYAISWSSSADEVKAYLDGEQVGSTQTSLGTWSGTLAAGTTKLGDSAATATLLGVYDEVRISDVARTFHPELISLTSANRMHAHSGRDYDLPYSDGDPLGFFYRDEIFTPKFVGGDYIIRNDWNREKLHPPNNLLSDPEELVFRGPDSLPSLGHLGRLSRLIGLFFDRISDDRHLIQDMFEVIRADESFFEGVANYLGLKGLDRLNWNVDLQRRFLHIMQSVHRRGGRLDSYFIYTKLLGFYVTAHTLIARRRWDSVILSAIDPNVTPIYLDQMGSMDTFSELYPLANLRWVFYKQSNKSSVGSTSAAASRLLTDSTAMFRDTCEIGSLIVIAQGESDAGDERTEAEYVVEEIHSDVEIKVDKDWQAGSQSDVTYYNMWKVPEPDPYTEHLLSQFENIVPDSMSLSRFDESA